MNLKTIKFYLIKLSTDFFWQPNNILIETLFQDVHLKITVNLEAVT